MDRQQPNLKQIFSPILIHQEEEPNVTEINESTADIADDISNIDTVIIDIPNSLL